MDKIEALELALIALEDEACNSNLDGCYDAQEIIRDLIEEIKKLALLMLIRKKTS